MKSFAIKIRDRPKFVLKGLTIVQAVSQVAAGYVGGFNPLFYPLIFYLNFW